MPVDELLDVALRPKKLSQSRGDGRVRATGLKVLDLANPKMFSRNVTDQGIDLALDMQSDGRRLLLNDPRLGRKAEPLRNLLHISFQLFVHELPIPVEGVAYFLR